MICPECASEYRDGIFRCPECELELVTAAEYDVLHPPPERDDSPAVTVFEANDIGSLELARSLLHEAGIGSSVRNERMLGLLPLPFGGSDTRQRPAELQVTERNEQRAREVLEPLLHPFELEDGADEPS